jgi:hypothetical protein
MDISVYFVWIIYSMHLWRLHDHKQVSLEDFDLLFVVEELDKQIHYDIDVLDQHQFQLVIHLWIIYDILEYFAWH